MAGEVDRARAELKTQSPAQGRALGWRGA